VAGPGVVVVGGSVGGGGGAASQGGVPKQLQDGFSLLAGNGDTAVDATRTPLHVGTLCVTSE
jgi:hypothetical protein